MIEDLIGNTPLYNLDKSKFNGKASVFAKLEMYNYTGSVKDRTALYMIVDAE
ncbi:MAG: pyridoxal-phosphate dependent enzyme, partial [Clostridia bacterium]